MLLHETSQQNRTRGHYYIYMVLVTIRYNILPIDPTVVKRFASVRPLPWPPAYFHAECTSHEM